MSLTRSVISKYESVTSKNFESTDFLSYSAVFCFILIDSYVVSRITWVLAGWRQLYASVTYTLFLEPHENSAVMETSFKWILYRTVAYCDQAAFTRYLNQYAMICEEKVIIALPPSFPS